MSSFNLSLSQLTLIAKNAKKASQDAYANRKIVNFIRKERVKKIVEVQSRRATVHHFSDTVVITHPKSELIGTTNFKKDCTLSWYGKTVGTPTASNWNITVLTEDGIVKVL